MNRQFKGRVSKDFRDQMIDYWVKTESCNRDVALGYYSGEQFDALCNRLIDGGVFEFTMDGDSETDCFESVDNNFVIPVGIVKQEQAA